jgi:hypothetical protein
MVDRVLDLKDGDRLKKALKGAASVPMTAEDVMRQRVSYVYGSIDADNGVTRERVRQLILEQEGRVEARR